MITILYAGLLGLFYIGLTVYVVKGRYKYRVALGDGGNPEMEKRVRAHGNFAENVPFALLLLFLTDYVQYAPIIIHVLGIALILARVFHMLALMQYPRFSWQRPVGVVLTILVILTCSVLLIWHFIALQMTGF